MDRRAFLRAGIASAGGAALLPSLATAASGRSAEPGESPYGSLVGIAPDENGLVLPPGFSSRIVAVAGEPVGGTSNTWHAFPDGAATFPDGLGGWYYVCNSEVFDFLTPTTGPQGGVGAIHFDQDGAIIDSYRILKGSHSNCAGGPTPWGTWLSCEEAADEQGRVYECDPTGRAEAVVREAMGRWTHEAVAVDPVDQRLYLTEDHPSGLLYRFSPDAYPDLSQGLLEAALVAADGSVTWGEVVDPSGVPLQTRKQVPGARTFAGGEGIWYYDGSVYFTSKLDNSVWELDLRNQQLDLIWQSDPATEGVEGAVLSGVDNITVDEGTGDLYVAEDGGNMELVIITPDGKVAPFCHIPDQDSSEITGPVFNPSRDRLYFSSQRGPSLKPLNEIINGFDFADFTGGVTYEVTGPFRGVEDNASVASPVTTVQSPVTTLAEAAAADPGSTEPVGDVPINDVAIDDDDTTGVIVGVGVGVVAVTAALGGAIALRNRGNKNANKVDIWQPPGAGGQAAPS